jgi:hypothetical protein
MAIERFLLLSAMLLSMVGTKAWAYDFSVRSSDGVMFYYN